MAALDGAAPRRYLLRFICEAHTANFRYAELDALLSARGLDPRVVVAARDRAATEPGFRPYAEVDLAPADCAAVVESAILVRDALEHVFKRSARRS